MTIDEPGYFERLARLEAAHWWSLAMWRLASDWLSSAIRGHTGLEALDIGCGAGLSLIRLAGQREIARVVGVEPDPGALRLARRYRGFELVEASALELPFDSESFDVITCFDVIQHLSDGGDQLAATEIARILKPGGVALIRANSSGFGQGRSSGGSAYRLREIIEILENSDLKVCRASYVNGLPSLAQEIKGRLRFLAGRRGASWRPHPSGGGLRLDVPSPRVNRVMGAVSTFERRLSSLFRCPLPFGHSTMVLAVKPGGNR
jgi:SAM-dependent methyltransferase